MSSNSINFFFHCYAGNDWLQTTSRMFRFLKHQHIRVTLAGNETDEQRLREIANKYHLTVEIKRNHDQNAFEHDAMVWLKQEASENVNGCTLYFHTKGMGNQSQVNEFWRNYMVFHFLRKWNVIHKRLQGSKNEVAGLWYGYHKNDPDFNNEESTFFAGNFWMAKNSYINKLESYTVLREQFGGTRYLAERYIGMRRPTVLFLNQSQALPMEGQNGIQWRILDLASQKWIRWYYQLRVG